MSDSFFLPRINKTFDMFLENMGEIFTTLLNGFVLV